MKNVISVIFLTLISTVVLAQNPLAKGQAQINAGLGFSGWGVPVYAGFDYGVHEDVSIGGELSFRSYSDRWASKRYHHSIVGISGNGNYHFNTLLDISDEWDFYAGANIGIYIWSSDNDYDGNHSTGVGLGGQVGGRYFFNEKIGVNLEFGGGNAFGGGKFGVTIKL